MSAMNWNAQNFVGACKTCHTHFHETNQVCKIYILGKKKWKTVALSQKMEKNS